MKHGEATAHLAHQATHPPSPDASYHTNGKYPVKDPGLRASACELRLKRQPQQKQQHTTTRSTASTHHVVEEPHHREQVERQLRRAEAHQPAGGVKQNRPADLQENRRQRDVRRTNGKQPGPGYMVLAPFNNRFEPVAAGFPRGA